MRKYILIALLFFVQILLIPVFADEWDDFATVERMWDGQKTITNKEFEEVMDVLEEKTQKKEEKTRKKRFRKIIGGGTSLHNDMGPDSEVTEIEGLDKEEGLLVNVPVNLLLGDNILDVGYYKVLAKRENDGKIYVSFYQSQFFKGKVEATETKDDYNEKELDFAKLLPYNEKFMKMIFGGIDFNAFVYIPFVEMK